MTNEELRKILENHQHWLNEDCDGWEDMNAHLRCADLRYAHLRYAHLRCADLSGADLRCADLRYADLSSADLSGAKLSGADLRCADLRYADLSDAKLSDADLSSADLSGADLRYAHLRCADLRYADLRCADLSGADLSGAKGGYFACPIEGEFVAWKKARLHGKSGGECIVKLLIPSDAKRLSSTSEKCRADKAVVLEVQDMDGNKIGECAYSNYEHAQDFEYKVGETVTPREPFDDDRWNKCSSGIHFFVDRRAAVEY